MRQCGVAKTGASLAAPGKTSPGSSPRLQPPRRASTASSLPYLHQPVGSNQKRIDVFLVTPHCASPQSKQTFRYGGASTDAAEVGLGTPSSCLMSTNPLHTLLFTTTDHLIQQSPRATLRLDPLPCPGPSTQIPRSRYRLGDRHRMLVPLAHRVTRRSAGLQGVEDGALGVNNLLTPSGLAMAKPSRQTY